MPCTPAKVFEFGPQLSAEKTAMQGGAEHALDHLAHNGAPPSGSRGCVTRTESSISSAWNLFACCSLLTLGLCQSHKHHDMPDSNTINYVDRRLYRREQSDQSANSPGADTSEKPNSATEAKRQHSQHRRTIHGIQIGSRGGTSGGQGGFI